MAHSEIFLLLPVFEEAEGQPFYLRTMPIVDGRVYERFLSAIDKMSDFFCYENYESYYDSENIKAFLIPVETMSDCYPKLLTRIRRKISRWGRDWRQHKTMSGTESCMVLESEVRDDTFSEIINRQQGNMDNSYLLLDYDALVHYEKSMNVLFHGVLVSVNCARLQIKDIAKWFEVNRRPVRIFHLNPKHGEFGKGAHPEHKGEKVSVLLCSRERAGQLLNQAVAESKDNRTLFFWDNDYESYIEFKGEGNNVYHGFHVNKEDEKVRVSNIVKSKIKKVIHDETSCGSQEV